MKFEEWVGYMPEKSWYWVSFG